MFQKPKEFAIITCLAGAATLGGFAYTIHQIPQPRSVSALEVAISQMPLGISIVEADQIVGSAPDEVQQQEGILLHRNILFSPSEETIKKLGPTQTYSLRIWRSDGVKAMIAIDSDDEVAGRWAWPDDDRT